MKKRILLLGLVTALVSGAMVGCGGQKPYPKAGDVTVIVPKAPGGGTDTAARGLVQYMKPNLEGVNFVVTNKPDGGGVTGMVETAKAKADGYTLGLVTVELAMFPHQGKANVTFEDYIPICAPIAAPAALVVPADAPYDNLDEFVAYCKENPDQIQVGNSGVGAIWHSAALAFEEEFDVSLKHIPYPNGTADIAAALTGGHINATMADPSSFKSQVEAGSLKILGIMADNRSAIYPDVPTFKELGYDMTIRAWAALVAPKDTPSEIVEQLRAAAKVTCESEEFKNYFANQGIDPQAIIGEDCYEMMQEDHAMYGELLKKLDIQ
ncbi:hypothetical protein CS063_11245 [Sporanaerobium hydrogeniformans]|uniref:Uncharacterized protein n=1 Tax=Sporanaerobium hydrogeniformans TaxID=3072179 RepID=A0AC61DCE9_9FIRM|nr:tripartite tricarboxylate transporter substrate binding protein [Sporanaerobium hydrogeniformans]PHV70237.1 hypothetical protein CS063_11245 [Sporanaerobium hydrogeniformans]